MSHPKQTPQVLNQPFNRKLSFVICFLLMVLSSVLNARAQTHPGMDGFQLPPKAKGDYYFSQGKFKEALEIYKSILPDEADPGPIFRGMVKAWNAMGALDEAKKYLSAYRQSHENSSAVWYALGYLHYLKGDNQKAEKLFKRATELDPDNGLAWNNWAASLAEGKHFQQAAEKVRIAILTNPKELMFFFNLKNIYEELGEEKKFEEEFNETLKNDADPFVWGYGKVLARSLRQKSFREYAEGNLAGALSGFEKILDIYRRIGDMKGQVPALFSLGLLHEESGDLQKGQEFFRQVLEINPNHIQAREKMKPKN